MRAYAACIVAGLFHHSAAASPPALCNSLQRWIQLRQGDLFAGCGHGGIIHRRHAFNKVTKNKLLLKKVTDHAFERHMEVEKKIYKLRRVIDIIRKQPRKSILYIYMLRMRRVAGLSPDEKMADFLAKYPGVIDLYLDKGSGLHRLRLPKHVVHIIREEKKVLQELAFLSVPRLQKLLMLSSTQRISLDSLEVLKPDLGLPDDFRQSVLEPHPQHFRIVKASKSSPAFVELVAWDPALAVPVLQKEREEEAFRLGLSEQEKKARAFTFPISYPPSFKIKISFRIKMQHWQRIRYLPLYQDVGDLDLESPQACKRAVAMLHEYLHLTVDKKSKVERIAVLREPLKLPKRIGTMVLEQPGIFYLSTKGHGQTVFLRSAYIKGELLQKDPLHVLKDNFIDLMNNYNRKAMQKQRGTIKSRGSNTTTMYSQDQHEFEDYGSCSNEENRHGMEDNSFSDEHASDDERFS